MRSFAYLMKICISLPIKAKFFGFEIQVLTGFDESVVVSAVLNSVVLFPNPVKAAVTERIEADVKLLWKHQRETY